MRYELLSRIGVGGMAEVFRARVHGEEGFTREVVLKRILPHLSANEDFRKRFVDEAKMTTHLRHANIVSVLDLGRINQQLFIAMELVEGTDLAWLLELLDVEKGERIPIRHALYIGVEILKGLHHAHEATGPDGQPLQIVHRDVSPPNTLISLSGEVKVCDFGIAKAAERTFHTKEGMVVGKIPFMAPEQVNGQTADRRTDVYSVGVVLNTLLGGDHPYQDDTDMRMIARITSGDLPPPSVLNPNIPPELDAIVAKATELHPDDRYQTAAEFADAIEDYAVEHQIKLSSRDLASWLEEQGVQARSGDPVDEPAAAAREPSLESSAPVEPMEPVEIEAVSFEEREELFDFSAVEESARPTSPKVEQRLGTDPDHFLELQTPAGSFPVEPDAPLEVEGERRVEAEPPRVARVLHVGRTPWALVRVLVVGAVAGAAVMVGIAWMWGAL